MPSSFVPNAAASAKTSSSAATSGALLQEPQTAGLPVIAVAAAVIAFLLRFAAVLIAKSYDFPSPIFGLPAPYQHWNFGFEMGRIARSIALGHGFGSPFNGWTGPTAWQPPIYPYLLAGIFRVFGVYSPAAGIVALALNCIVAALTTVLIYRIAERICGREVAFWAAWLWAVLPSMMEYAVFWAWETEITTLLLMLAIWLTLTLPEKKGGSAWLKLGALWGVIALINTTLLSMMPFTFAWAWWQTRERHRSWYCAAALLLLFAITVPWILRDRLVMGKWMFLRDNLWAEISYGNDFNSPRAWLTWRHPGSDPGEFRRYASLGELKYIAQKKQMVLSTFRRYPDFFLRTTMQHVVLFWSGPFEFFSDDLQPYEVLYFHSPAICLSALAWAGLLLMLLDRRAGSTRRKFGWLLAPAILIYPLVFYIATPDPRYRHIVEPIMLILAVYAVVSRVQAARSAAPELASTPSV
jgi:4-amino-4-deoxy-L-arabinose transferase-like glycosyltransferase